MPRVGHFYSVNEPSKAPQKRVHHNNSSCASGRDIPANERCYGRGGYRLCKHCKRYR